MDGFQLPSLGERHHLEYIVQRDKTVPFLYAECAEFQRMPHIFATGFMVALIEWCCVNALAPYLKPGQGSLGTFIEVTHQAPTPIGMKVHVEAICERIRSENNVFWTVTARDQSDIIGIGQHGRHLVEWDRFNQRVADKAATL